MEGGRQAEIAQGILASKNVPYMVAAPLLIQVCGIGPVQRLEACCRDRILEFPRSAHMTVDTRSGQSLSCIPTQACASALAGCRSAVLASLPRP